MLYINFANQNHLIVNQLIIPNVCVEATALQLSSFFFLNQLLLPHLQHCSLEKLTVSFFFFLVSRLSLTKALLGATASRDAF